MLKGKTPLVVAVALGLAAALMAFHTMKRTEDRLVAQWETKFVVVAARDIAPGTVLDYDLVARMKTPVQFITPSVVRPAQVEQVIGQTVMIPVQRGDPIMWSQFSEAGAVERLSDVLQKRGRAISLDIAGDKAVAGWVRPADHVDVLGTFKDPKDNRMVTVTMMENVVVLATGQRAAGARPGPKPPDQHDYNTVTLYVLPEEAEILTLADQLGSLRLTLRHHGDMGRMEQRRRTTIHTILTGTDLKEMRDVRAKLPELIYLDRGK